MSILPHANQIRQDVSQYLTDAADLAADASKKLARSDSFRAVYKIALATDTVLSGLTDKEVPRFDSARGLIQKVPLLIAWGQLAAAKVELRRFIEVAFWSIYFTDHRREWDSFQRDPARGYERDLSRPISLASHRELSYYVNYAKELFESEPSGVPLKRLDQVHTEYGNLSAVVHPGEIAVAGARVPGVDDLSGNALPRFMERTRTICSGVCCMAAAFQVHRFDLFQPIQRAWFDWLLGAPDAKALRAGRFGLR